MHKKSKIGLTLICRISRYVSVLGPYHRRTSLADTLPSQLAVPATRARSPSPVAGGTARSGATQL